MLHGRAGLRVTLVQTVLRGQKAPIYKEPRADMFIYKTAYMASGFLSLHSFQNQTRRNYKNKHKNTKQFKHWTWGQWTASQGTIPLEAHPKHVLSLQRWLVPKTQTQLKHHPTLLGFILRRLNSPNLALGHQKSTYIRRQGLYCQDLVLEKLLAHIFFLKRNLIF